MKLRVPEIFLGKLLAVAIFAMGCVFWTSQRQFAQDESATKTGQSSDNKQQNETWWQRATDPIAVFTLGLVFVGGAQLGFFYWQLRLIRESLHDAEKAADAAKEAANAAREGNQLTREIFVAEQRPWLLWRLPNTATIIRIGQQLSIRISGEFENIGKTPALNVTYFGKFYRPAKSEAIMDQGIAFYSENLRQTLQWRFSLANILPTEKIPINFSPQGIEIVSLPSDEDFVLCLAFHTKYEFSQPLKQLAEIGTVYMVQPLSADRITFKTDNLVGSTAVALVEYPGVRRLT